MDPDAPKPKNRGDSPSETGRSARDRAEALAERKAKAESAEKRAASKGGSKTRPPLTEKQRIEARKKRQASRRRPEAKGNPLSKGLRTVGFEVKRTAVFLGSAVIAALAALGPVFSAAGMGLVWLVEKAGQGLKLLLHLIRRVLAAIGRLVSALDSVLTPQRAMILVGALAAVLLGVSQYKGLGAIEIGQPGYSGIEDLARAPAIDRTTPAGVHTRIFVPIAAVALLAVVDIALGTISSQAARFSRWRRFSSMVLVMIGLLTLVVALLIDLPDATDPTSASSAYAEVTAILLSGFWLELAAGVSLAVAGIALLLEPLPHPTKSRRRESQSSKIAGSRA